MEIADHNLGPEDAQGSGPLIFAPDQRTDWQGALPKQFHHRAAHRADAAGSACDKDGTLDWHMVIPPQRARHLISRPTAFSPLGLPSTIAILDLPEQPDQSV
jgi:hypothetical protein